MVLTLTPRKIHGSRGDKGKIFSLKNGCLSRGVQRVANLIDAPNRRWNEHLLAKLCDDLLVEDVRKLDLLSCQIEDMLCWIGNKSGRFLVKSCFQL